MFRDAWRRAQRGLIPTDGFYEWGVERGRKQPWFIRRRDGQPMLLAALWDRWERPGREPLESCTILVGPANALVAPLHERMPIIIPLPEVGLWLNRAASEDRIAELLRPFPPGELEAYRVSTKVNSAASEGPELVTPL
jgi:putative SOS response-associated peptidase YedK